MTELLTKLREAGLDKIENARLMIDLARNHPDEALDIIDECRAACVRGIEQTEEKREWNRLYRQTLLFAAPYRFDDYLMYLEINRKPEERFYMPRRRVLLPLVEALQALEDGELQELFISEPPRVGKTMLLNFYMTWLIGRDSERSNLYCAYSDQIVKMFYQGVLSVLTDDVTYTWGEVFPGHEIQSTDAKDGKLNLDRAKPYPSLTCRSLYGTLNGACDCNGLLIADDLLSGIEEALSKDRLMTAWGKADNNMLPRAKENAKILWVGTRWSMVDPIGVRLDMLQNEAKFKGRKWKEINVPALNENDESNFVYDYGVGFSTEFYHQRRASFERNNDMASWLAQYMGEPIEREGALFEPEGMNYYNGVLPEEEPVAVYACVDVAWGGGDFLSMPIVYEYENGEKYVHGWVFDNHEKRITQPLVAHAIKRYGVGTVEFEANNGGHEYRDDIERILKAEGVRCKLVSRPAPTNKRKEMRIVENAADIRDMFFIDDGHRSKEYQLAMQNLFSFKILGKNKNDDAPDSLAMLVYYHARTPLSKPKIFGRPF